MRTNTKVVRGVYNAKATGSSGSTSGSENQKSTKSNMKGSVKQNVKPVEVEVEEDEAVLSGHPNPALGKAYMGCGLATTWMPSPGVTRSDVFPIILIDHDAATPGMVKGLKTMLTNKNNQLVVFISASKRPGPTHNVDYYETFGVVPKDAIIEWTPANQSRILKECSDAEKDVANTQQQNRPVAAVERLKEIKMVYGKRNTGHGHAK